MYLSNCSVVLAYIAGICPLDKTHNSFSPIYIYGIKPHGQRTRAHIDRKEGAIGVSYHLYEGSGAEINDLSMSSYISLLPMRFDCSEAALSLIVVIARPKSEED